jgi:type I restriction-modification system DNA methylase subunit
MVDREEAKKQIIEIVNDFKANYQEYKKAAEADIETKLIEELFIKALGWTKNDFTKQAKVRRGEKRGEADYAFKMGDRTVFFLEVKRVGIPLAKEADKQVISYALSRRVPIAVSTNFEQMKIFCVEQENAINNVFRVFGKPEDYIDNLQDLLFLSKESFEEDLLIKKAADEGRLKKRISINKPLLEDLMVIRKLIADDIERNYPKEHEPNAKEEIVQRIIDRLIFIRHCEDVGINPDDLVLKEITFLQDTKAYNRLKEIFKRYDDVYNSGLFAVGVDNDCDRIKIGGEIIKKLICYLYESRNGQYIYNFKWIDADVLGQVYEQYLGKILAQTKSGKARLKDGQAHKKEQGIYYTPTYIVDYIAKNTVGELLKDKKVKAKEIKVLDPACGSGSFLIKAYDYLYASMSVDKESKQRKFDSLGMYSVKTEILKNNIFGVDLDNKAVEITKLNLLLKAAEKERKLPKEVDNHIRQGNSLIDDEAVAGLDAFKWHGDFQEGTFDVVIGNPPYVRIQTLDTQNVEFFNSHYKSATKNYDIYALFVERAVSLLKEGGIMGFILPSKFFNADYGEGLRKVISDHKLLYKIVNFKDFQVFDGATTYTCLLFLRKTRNKGFEYLELAENKKLADTKVLHNEIFKKSRQEQPGGSESWNFLSDDSKGLIDKLDTVKLRLGDISKNIFQGITTSADRIYLLQLISDEGNFFKVLSKATEKEYSIEKGLLKPILKGQEIKKWDINKFKYLLLFPYEIKNEKAYLMDEDKIRRSFPKTYEYLQDCKKLLEAREEGKVKGTRDWYGYIYRKNLEKFEQAKLLTQVLASRNSFTFDEKGEYYFVGGGNAGGYGIVLKDEYVKDYYDVIALLNSKLLEFYLRKTSTPFRGGFYSYGKRFIEKLPIVMPSEKDKIKLAEHSKSQLEKSKHLAEFGNKKTSESARLEEEIRRTDAEIDELVYKIYGITEEEKKIIKECLK